MMSDYAGRRGSCELRWRAMNDWNVDGNKRISWVGVILKNLSAKKLRPKSEAWRLRQFLRASSVTEHTNTPKVSNCRLNVFLPWSSLLW